MDKSGEIKHYIRLISTISGNRVAQISDYPPVSNLTNSARKMARSTSALHRMVESNNENVMNDNTPSPKKFHVRRSSTSTTKSLFSDAEMAFESDSSTSSRRSRKNWTETEEACLISGVAKYGENWENILNDEEYSFNERVAKDLRIKYRALIKTNSIDETIFDIRTANEKVTEVFIGPDWSRAHWVSSESVKPESRFESLLSDFEKKIAAKQKMISRISPARTPSRYISNLAINSAVKRRNVTPGESSASENEIGTPLKKTKQQLNNESLTSSPLSVRSVKSNKSSRSVKSNTQQVLMVHSDVEAEEADGEGVVYPGEDGEPNNEQKSMMSRCIIM